MADVIDDNIDHDDDDDLQFPSLEVESDIEVEIVEEETEEEKFPTPSEDSDAVEDEPEEEGPVDTDDLSEEDGKEIESYSKNVQKRILREIRAKKRVEEELHETKAKVSQYIAKLHEEGKSTFTRAESLQKQYDDMQDSYATLLESNLNEKAAWLTEKLKRAKNEGDTDAEVSAMSELSSINQQRTELSGITRGIKSTREGRTPVKNIWEVTATPQQQPAQQAAPPTPRGQKWKDSRTWYGKAKYAEATEFAHIVDKALVASKMDPNSAAYFVELDRRIAKRFPELYKSNQTTSPVAAVSSGTAGSKTPKGKVQLTRKDLAKMQSFGLDPNNKSHLRQWALSKQGA